jgi:transposase InsO family protein
MKYGKRYSAQFKRDAVELLISGKSISELSLDLHVGVPTLWRWKKEYLRDMDGRLPKDHLQTPLPLQALADAQQTRRAKPGLLHHSDRGCQYASASYQQQLLSYGFTPSMSRPGCCHDNAAMESFWSSLKSELDLKRKPFTNLAQAQRALFDYIEIFYNRQRLHSSLNYLSPLSYEQKHLSFQ